MHFLIGFINLCLKFMYIFKFSLELDGNGCFYKKVAYSRMNEEKIGKEKT